MEEVTDEDLINNPYILSNGESTGKYSFVDPKQPPRKTCPPPIYFDEKILLEQLPKEKAVILKSFKEQKNGTLVCTDKEILDK